MKLNFFSSTTNMYEALEQDLRKKIASSKKNNLAISGGSTPLPLFEKLGKEKIVGPTEDFNVLWADERFVPRSDLRNNYTTAFKVWLSHQKGINIYPIQTENISIAESVSKYRNILQKVGFLDVVLLGMGEDGHIASIFPSTKNAENEVLHSMHPSDGTQRISLGYKTLMSAREIWLLIKGKEKLNVLQNGNDLPIHHLTNSRDITVYYCE